MKKLLAFGGMFFVFGILATGQDGLNYTVRFKPLPILDEQNKSVLIKVPKSKSLLIYSYNIKCDCFYARYGDISGVVSPRSWLVDVYYKPVKKNFRYEFSDSLRRLLTEYRLANDREPDEVFTLIRSGSENQADLEETLEIINKWGYTNGKRIAEGKIWPGMSVEMALESWGIPYRVHVTRGGGGIREQWIYSDAYLYFENGTLAEILKLNKADD